MDAVSRARELDVASRLEVLDNVGCGIWLFDGEDVRYVNREMAVLTGYTRDELLQPQFFSTLLHADYVEMVLERGRARLRGERVPEDYEAALIAKDGSVVHLALHARVVELPIGQASLVSAVDITAQKRAEAAQGTSEAYYRSLLDTVPAHVMTTDPHGKATYVNGYWLEYTGLSLKESLQRGTAQAVHPEDGRAANRAWRRAMREGTGYDIDYRIRHRSGTYRWQSWRIRPVFREGVELLGWTGVGLDVDDAKRLQIQLEQANADLIAANRVKDEFLALVSHELRTPLTTIGGLAGLLVRQHRGLAPEELQDTLVELQQDAGRLSAIVENLLALARLEHEPLEFEPVLPQRLVAEVVDSLRRANPGAKVRLMVAPGVPPIASQPTLFRLLVENLVANALKYSPAGAAVAVKVGARDGQVSIEVLDRGWGIEEGDEERIFEPFYRANPRAGTPGLGLGLAVCKRLAELHGGSISARARAGGGSAFELLLPEMPVIEAGLPDAAGAGPG
jgi:PAS domain S-box-containing protein